MRGRRLPSRNARSSRPRGHPRWSAAQRQRHGTYPRLPGAGSDRQQPSRGQSYRPWWSYRRRSRQRPAPRRGCRRCRRSSVHGPCRGEQSSRALRGASSSRQRGCSYPQRARAAAALPPGGWSVQSRGRRAAGFPQLRPRRPGRCGREKAEPAGPCRACCWSVPGGRAGAPGDPRTGRAYQVQ